MTLDLDRGRAWLQTHGRRPFPGVHGFHWRNAGAAKGGLLWPEEIPRAIFSRLAAAKADPARSYEIHYNTAQEALDDAARAVAEALVAGELED